MLNLRPIDEKFYLSGGWTDVPKNAKWLEFNHFRAILDLQFTPSDFTSKSESFIFSILDELGIKYAAVLMSDDENNDLKRLFDKTSDILEEWDGLYKGRRDKILVKCGAGVSRSVAVLIDYYCKRDRLTYSEAKAIISKVDRYNYGGLPIGIHPYLENYLRNTYPETSAFGVKND